MSPPEDARLVGDGYLSIQKVMKRFGVSKMTIWRWEHDAAMDFPKSVKFGFYRYWSKAELAAWEAERLQSRSAA